MTSALSHTLTANLDFLALMLEACARTAIEARDAIAADRMNLAIGTIRPLERTLPECEALLKSTIALARFQTADNGSLL